MDIKDQTVQVAALPFDEHGNKLEPEQQPAKVTQSGAAPLVHGGENKGALPISIEQHLTAGALAATIRDPCGSCKHFDRTAWLKYVKFLQSTYDGRNVLNNVMANLIDTQNMSVQDLHRSPIDGDFDTTHAVNSLAACRILSEIEKDVVAVHPLGVCPPELRSVDRPRGMYVAVDKDTERAGSAAFDTVMKAACKTVGTR